MIVRLIASVGVATVIGCGSSSGAAEERDTQSTSSRAGTAVADAARQLRFVRDPVVLFTELKRDGGETTLLITTTIRTSRRLPRGDRGVRANIALDGNPSFVLPWEISRSPACYTADSDSSEAPSFRDAKDGQPVQVVVSFRGRRLATTTVKARRATYSSMFNETRERRRYRRLGCGPQRGG